MKSKEKEFVEEYIQNGNNATKAVKEVYNIEDENYASVKGHRLIRKDKVKEAILSLSERIPDDKLHEVLMEGLKAGKTVFKNNNSTGEIEEVGYEPDYAVRHKYLDTELKLKGLYENDEQKNINILMPVLVKFLNGKEDRSDNGNTQ